MYRYFYSAYLRIKRFVFDKIKADWIQETVTPYTENVIREESVFKVKY